MNFKNEQQLLFVIRYALPMIILALSLLITSYLYYENKASFEKMKKSTEARYISDKKKMIKEQVDNVYNYIISEQEDTENALKHTLIKRVHEAHTISTNIYNQYKKGHTKNEISLMIKSAIKDIRFNNGRGYFFLYDKNATNIMHPLVPKLEGKNLFNHQDTKGTYVLRESLSLLKDHDEAYQEWFWRRDKNSLEEFRKIGFVKNIYELDWFIGTGEYIDDFSKDIQAKVLSQINKFKFGPNGYMFVISKENHYLANRRTEVIGKSVFKQNNLKNTKLIMNKMWEKAKNNGGFIQYIQKQNPITKKPTIKVGYVKFIPQWNWLVGTGFYLDDVQVVVNKQKEILVTRYNDNLKNVIILSALATAILLLLSFYISMIIERKFKQYKKDIHQHISENQKQYELLAQKSKLAAMGEMIENIAHQWRQPLSAITTASSGIKLQKEMNILTDKLLNDAVDNIGVSANHLSETIEDFRDFFKPDKEKSLFSLKSAVDKTLKLLDSQIKNKEIVVIKTIEDINIEGFERELLQVLLNIINNASDALEHRIKNRYIFINIYKDDGFFIIKVKDNAGGIKESIIERIFEPYFTTKHKSQGTGLGLYMSEEIISRHMNGTLTVENSVFLYDKVEYTGAIFSIKIPLK